MKHAQVVTVGEDGKWACVSVHEMIVHQPVHSHIGVYTLSSTPDAGASIQSVTFSASELDPVRHSGAGPAAVDSDDRSFTTVVRSLVLELAAVCRIWSAGVGA